MRLALSFDDVLLEPRTSTVLRSDIHTSSQVTKKIYLPIPIMSAAMDRVTEDVMAITMGKAGSLGVLHRNCKVEKQVEWVKKIKSHKLIACASIGPTDFTRAELLVKNGCDILVVDTAHGQNLLMRDFVKKLKQTFDVQVIAGNVATKESALPLLPYVDAIKVGVGPGSICTTRIVTGVGVPQLSAILEIAKTAKTKKVPIIADGGIKSSGDIVKALAAGASSVMLGSMFAGTDESPGKKIVIKGQVVKEYRGMGSLEAMSTDLSSDRYAQKGKQKKIAEGIAAYVPYKGSVLDILEQLHGGLISGMHYLGTKTVQEMPIKAKFVQITNAGLVESKPHSVIPR